MDYVEEVEELRKRLINLVNQKCDNILKVYNSKGIVGSPVNIVSEVKLGEAVPYYLKGKKPIAVIFDGKQIETRTWKLVAAVILTECNREKKYHEQLLYLCDKVLGKNRVILGSKYEGMKVPIKIDEGVYFEAKFDTESLIRVLKERVLKPIGFDMGRVVIKYSFK